MNCGSRYVAKERENQPVGQTATDKMQKAGDGCNIELPKMISQAGWLRRVFLVKVIAPFVGLSLELVSRSLHPCRYMPACRCYVHSDPTPSSGLGPVYGWLSKLWFFFGYPKYLVRIMIGIQKGAIILTTTHIPYNPLTHYGSFHFLFHYPPYNPKFPP